MYDFVKNKNEIAKKKTKEMKKSQGSYLQGKRQLMGNVSAVHGLTLNDICILVQNAETNFTLTRDRDGSARGRRLVPMSQWFVPG